MTGQAHQQITVTDLASLSWRDFYTFTAPGEVSHEDTEVMSVIFDD